MRTDYLQVRITDEEKTELANLVERMDDPEMSVSRFVRDAVREKKARLERKLTQKEQTAATTAA